MLVEIESVLVYDPGTMEFFKFRPNIGVERLVLDGGDEFDLVRYEEE